MKNLSEDDAKKLLTLFGKALGVKVAFGKPKDEDDGEGDDGDGEESGAGDADEGDGEGDDGDGEDDGESGSAVTKEAVQEAVVAYRKAHGENGLEKARALVVKHGKSKKLADVKKANYKALYAAAMKNEKVAKHMKKWHKENDD